MANELTVGVSLSYTKGNQRIARALMSFYHTIAGSGASLPTVSVGTAEEDFSVGDIGTPGFLWLRNLDDTNYVTWGPKDSGAMITTGRLLPTTDSTRPVPPTLIYFDSGSVIIRWKAHTGACLVEAILLPA